MISEFRLLLGKSALLASEQGLVPRIPHLQESGGRTGGHSTVPGNLSSCVSSSQCTGFFCKSWGQPGNKASPDLESSAWHLGSSQSPSSDRPCTQRELFPRQNPGQKRVFSWFVDQFEPCDHASSSGQVEQNAPALQPQIPCPREHWKGNLGADLVSVSCDPQRLRQCYSV